MPMSSATSLSTMGLRCAIPFSKNSPLNFKNAFHDLVDGLLALVDAANEPCRGAHFVLDVVLGLAADGLSPANGVSVVRIDTQLGHAVVVDHDDEFVPGLYT
jgi:hypothetical protein